MADFQKLGRESTEHLQRVILPFWKNLTDREHGGYYGLVTDDLAIHRMAEKGCILNSRILWFFSGVYRMSGDRDALAHARHAYRFLLDAFLDREQDGVFWSVTADGRPADDSKHCYCHAFAVYALASYAQAERDDAERAGEARGLALHLFDLIEGRMRDQDGYLEAFARDFSPASNEKLSENGVEAARTMNTALHVLEAYTELLLALNEQTPEREIVEEKLADLLDLFLDRIYLPDKRRLGVFFDKDYRSLIDLWSYGHDIEAAWLIDRALETLKDYPREGEIRAMTATLTDAVYRTAYRESGEAAFLLTERENGVDKENRVWWIQAEAVNGFLNGARRAEKADDTMLAGRYADAAARIWMYIKEYVVDPREGSEWFWALNPDGTPDHTYALADPWKCPYHNGRMCMMAGTGEQAAKNNGGVI
ncbi:MAG: AGE family epimerase/isomerase [Lachnospiraceae bacterium]|nr:AGE family epimerase/isomerase [Lachnospiraceae bacterium]